MRTINHPGNAVLGAAGRTGPRGARAARTAPGRDAPPARLRARPPDPRPWRPSTTPTPSVDGDWLVEGRRLPAAEVDAAHTSFYATGPTCSPRCSTVGSRASRCSGCARRRSADETAAAPVVPDAPGHGVVRLAAQLAGTVGAAGSTWPPRWRPPRTRVHVHVTDRLFGATAEEATQALVALARRHPTTVTLHDVPQPGDGAVFDRRAATLRRAAGRGRGLGGQLAPRGRPVEQHLRAGDARRGRAAAGARARPRRRPPAAPDRRRRVVGVARLGLPRQGPRRGRAGLRGHPTSTVRAAGWRVARATTTCVDDLPRSAREPGVRLRGHRVGGRRRSSASSCARSTWPSRRTATSRPPGRSTAGWPRGGARWSPPAPTPPRWTRLRPGTLTLVDDDALARGRRRGAGRPRLDLPRRPTGTAPAPRRLCRGLPRRLGGLGEQAAAGAWVPGNRWDLAPARSPAGAPRHRGRHPLRAARELARTLAALAGQTHPADLLQVVVADDGSPTPPQVPAGVEVVTQPDEGFRAAAHPQPGRRAGHRRRAALPRRRHRARAGVRRRDGRPARRAARGAWWSAAAATPTSARPRARRRRRRRAVAATS